MAEVHTSILREPSLNLAITVALSMFGFLTKAVAKIEQLSVLRQSWLSPGESVSDEAAWMVFMGMLAYCRGSLATDKRDRLYALLGLLPSTVVSQLQPLYSQSFDETWTRAMSLILQKSGSLILFSQIRVNSASPHTPEPPRQENSKDELISPATLTSQSLPSWAPDWFGDAVIGERLVADDLDFRIARETMFPKYVDDRYQNGCSIHVDQDQNLHLSGIRIDEVEKTIMSHLSGKAPHVPYIAASCMLMSCDTWASVHDQQIDHRARDIVIIRTLVSDCFPDTDASPPFRRVTANDIDTLYQWYPTADDIHTLYQGYSTAVPAILAPNHNIDPVLLHHMMMNLSNKAIFITREKGYLGMTPASCQTGDIVFLLSGGTHPVLLRPASDENETGCQYWTVVGECSGIFGLDHGKLASENLIWEDVQII
ncbi:MAG: hypothetical protein Q9221_003879 [Calogaya cf. arnoldii]